MVSTGWPADIYEGIAFKNIARTGLLGQDLQGLQESINRLHRMVLML
ncbi:MAG: hypothetical protein U0U46_05085 [Saprospiraceae bacterium]